MFKRCVCGFFFWSGSISRKADPDAAAVWEDAREVKTTWQMNDVPGMLIWACCFGHVDLMGACWFGHVDLMGACWFGHVDLMGACWFGDVDLSMLILACCYDFWARSTGHAILCIIFWYYFDECMSSCIMHIFLYLLEWFHYSCHIKGKIICCYKYLNDSIAYKLTNFDKNTYGKDFRKKLWCFFLLLDFSTVLVNCIVNIQLRVYIYIYYVYI